MGLIPLVAYLIIGMATAAVAHLFITVSVFEKLAEDGDLELGYKYLSYLTLFVIYFLIAPFMMYVLFNPIAADSFEVSLYNSFKQE